MKKRRVLVLSPHPDDEAIGCGGTLRWHLEQGDRVQVIFLTSGEHGVRGQDARETSRIRTKEAVGSTIHRWPATSPVRTGRRSQPCPFFGLDRVSNLHHDVVDNGRRDHHADVPRFVVVADHESHEPAL